MAIGARREVLSLALIVGFIGGLAVPRSEPPSRSLCRPRGLSILRLTAFVEAVAGALVGLLAGWVFALAARSRNRNRPSHSPQNEAR